MWWTGAVISRQAREREEADRESQARQAADLIERKRSNETIAALNAQLSADLIATVRMHEMSLRLVQAEEVSTLLQEIVDAQRCDLDKTDLIRMPLALSSKLAVVYFDGNKLTAIREETILGSDVKADEKEKRLRELDEIVWGKSRGMLK